MKQSINILLALMVFFFSACEMNEIDTAELTDFAPGLSFLTPSDGGKIVQGNFDIVAGFADGNTSPLASVDLVLMDTSETELFTHSATLSGTRDTLKLAAEDFDAASLEVGIYTLKMTVADSKGQVSEMVSTFEISKLPFAANNDEMYVAGGFNGWSWDSLKLVSDYTWEIKNLEMDGGEWKFKNTKDWSDQDWGDGDCNGVMEITTGGGANTNCGYSGLVNVRFNDQTLQYTVEPAVTIETNINSLFLLGSFNDFQGEEFEFTSTEDHIWVLDEIELRAGYSFRFSEGAFGGLSFGDNEPDSIADESAPNIKLAGDFPDAIYSITFNDETREYTFTFVRNLFPSELFLVGGSTVAGWDPASSVQFVSTGEGHFEMYTYLTVAGDGFKLLQERDWAGDWGADPANTGSLLQDGENNLSVSGDGFYRINVNFIDGTYSITASNWGVIGDATPAGWDADTDMTLVSAEKGNYTWTLDVTLGDGEMKFRENDGWDVNFGDSGADGSLEYGGDNIAVSAGTYTVTLVLDPVNGYTYSIQ